METIRIKYLSDKIDKIKKIDKGDWIDLRSSENISLKKGESVLIPLGVAMEIPDGYEAHIVPRSSTFKKWGVIQTNHCGIVDQAYSGNNDIFMMPVLAMRDTKIKVNDRVCQFRIIEKQPNIKFVEVDDLGNADRGGFGSTGHN